MKKIILSIIVSLFIVGNSFAYSLNDGVKMIDGLKTKLEDTNNECKANPGDNKIFFTCLINHTKSDNNSFGVLETLFGKNDIKIEFGDNINYTQVFDNGYLNKCSIKKEDKQKFIKTLEKWSTGSFGTSDLGYVTCTLEKVNSNKEELSKININDLELIEETSSYKLLKGNNKGYLYTKAKNGIKFNGKELGGNLCEITGSNGKGLKYVGSYLVDNISIYEDKSYIDYQSGNYLCEINKVNHNLDVKTLKYLDKSYLYKDKNGIYYFHGGIFENGKIIKLKNIDELTIESLGGGYYKDKKGVYYLSNYGDFNKLEKVDLESFEIIDSFFKKAYDKNYFYIRGKIDKKRVNLIKKDNVKIDDFKVKNETISSGKYIKGRVIENNGEKIDLSRTEFKYCYDIVTNIDGFFKISGIRIENGILNRCYEFDEKDFDKNGIKVIKYTLNIKKLNSYDSWRENDIGIIKRERKIKFTKNMDKPIFVNEEKELSNKNNNKNNNKKVDLLLEKFDKKLSKKSLKSKLDVYKNLNFKLKKLKEKHKSGKNTELINYLYEKIHKKYLVTFKEYVLEKRKNN